MRLAIGGLSGTIEASGFGRLNHAGLDTISEEIAIKANRSRGQRTHTCLHKDVGRLAQALGGQLFLGLAQHRGVSLHHPFWNIRIPFPCRIRDDFPAVMLRVLINLADRIIIVSIYHHDLRSIFLDRLDTALCGELVHVDNGSEPHLRSRPCHPTPVISICRGRKGNIAQFFAQGSIGKVCKRQFPTLHA